MVQLKKDRPAAFRVAGTMVGADAIMNEVLFVGTYPGLTRPMLDYVIEVIQKFCRGKSSCQK
jgi:CDP-6-deoxy-D-xylo-4-hexulose-3-dehydrase